MREDVNTVILKCKRIRKMQGLKLVTRRVQIIAAKQNKKNDYSVYIIQNIYNINSRHLNQYYFCLVKS